jgi:hypothetical protein
VVYFQYRWQRISLRSRQPRRRRRRRALFQRRRLGSIASLRARSLPSFVRSVKSPQCPTRSHPTNQRLSPPAPFRRQRRAWMLRRRLARRRLRRRKSAPSPSRKANRIRLVESARRVRDSGRARWPLGSLNHASRRWKSVQIARRYTPQRARWDDNLPADPGLLDRLVRRITLRGAWTLTNRTTLRIDSTVSRG